MSDGVEGRVGWKGRVRREQGQGWMRGPECGGGRPAGTRVVYLTSVYVWIECTATVDTWVLVRAVTRTWKTRTSGMLVLLGLFWYVVGLFWYVVGLFWYVVGLFWYMVSLFWYMISLFWYMVGLFWYVVGLFWYVVGLFCHVIETHT
jgi:hypothetical protein